MTIDNLPYFFNETQADRTELSERQRTRNFTLKDLDWLDTVYLATDALRRAQKIPMHVETLHVSVPGQQAIELAGAFVMSPAPEGGVFLYTPARGLEKRQNHAALKSQLVTWLKDVQQRQALLDYLSISQQATLTPTSAMTITTHTVADAVFETQQKTLSTNRLENARLMREQLLELPSFTFLLDEYIAAGLAESFVGVDPRKIQVKSYVVDAVGPSNSLDTPPRHVATRSLGETVLRYFVTNDWPVGETRRYFNPQRIPGPNQVTQEADDQLLWEASVRGLAQGLNAYMKQQPKQFWQMPARAGLSRLQLFTNAMTHTFFTVLLNQQQQSLMTAEQRLQLQRLPLKTALGATTPAPSLTVEKVRLDGPELPPVELAGTLIIRDNNGDDDSPWLLYRPHHGLHAFTERDSLETHLLESLNPQHYPNAWANHLSRLQRYSEADLQACNVSIAPVTGVIFQSIMEGIIQKQGQNLEYALDQYRLSDGTMDLDPLVDRVLDARAMIDPTLLTLDPMGRWSTQLAATWTANVTEPRVPPTLSAMRSALQLLENITAQVQRHASWRPSLERSATTYINTRLRSVKQQQLQAGCLSVRHYAGDEPRLVSSSSLVEYFLARVCGDAERLIDSPNTHIYSTVPGKPATKLSGLDIAAFNKQIDSARDDFFQYVRRTHSLYPEMEPLLGKAMEMGLTGEMQWRLWNKVQLPIDYEILMAVLGIYARDLRRSVNGFRPDGFLLRVTAAGQNAVQALNNCFVLTERGGLDPQYSGRVLLWTPALGLEAFHSLDSFNAALDRRLAAPDERLAFLENLEQPDWHSQPTYTLSSLELVEANLVEHVQRTFAQSKDRQLREILSRQHSVQQLHHLWQVQATQNLAPTNVQRATDMIQAMIVQHGLQWLGQARAVDQQIHVELLEQYRNNVEDNQDYLHGIDPLPQFTQKQLSALLQQLDAQNTVTPDEIEVGLPAQGSTPARNQALLDYALSHQSYWKDDVPFFASTGATPLSDALDPQTLKTRIQALNINAAYQAYVKSFLGPDSPDRVQRYRRFAKQLPWQLMQYAHSLSLQGRLSPAAFGLIQQVMDMPDAIARALVVGANATIRPLELLIDAGKRIIKVVGVYLIDSAPGDKAPRILYAPYSCDHTLKEYTDDAALLAELTSAGALQQWILRLVPAVDHAALACALGQATASTSVQLANTPINGPLFKQLFNDNAELLATLLSCQNIADAATPWETAKAVFSEGVTEAVAFFAGKLAYPLVVWQSYKLFKTSAEELQSHQWQEALGHFIGGVSRLASLSRSLSSVPESTTPLVPEPGPSSPAAIAVVSWPTLDITAAQRTQFQRYEVLEPSLASLTEDTSLNLYRSALNQYYAAVEGKVYQVVTHGLGWRVIGSAEVGPVLQSNPRRQWMLSSSDLVLMGRRAVARLTNRFYSEPIARSNINILASGMREIRALYAQESLMITEALALATFYARNALDNLHVLTQTPLAVPELAAHIKSFFGLSTIEAEHLEKIRESVSKVAGALMEPSLTSPESTRFVIGRSRIPTLAGTYKVMAFTIVPDPSELVYLTEAFFSPNLSYSELLLKPFYVNAHARATSLIHELTHHVCATLDLAYVLSIHPFHDLIDPQTPLGKTTKKILENRQRSKLSLSTPEHELFTVLDIATGAKTDPSVGNSTELILKRLLSITGTQTLNDARRVFRTDPLKRVIILLSNADSVAYLIVLLGRQKVIPVGQTSQSP